MSNISNKILVGRQEATIGGGSKYNTFIGGSDFKIGNSCSYNLLYTPSHYIIESEVRRSNLWGSSSNHSTIIGRNCSNLYIQAISGAGLQVGPSCSAVTIGANNSYVMIGPNCTRITLDSNCHYTTIGTDSTDITITNSRATVIGIGCSYITIGANSNYNSIGDLVWRLSIGEKCTNNVIGHGCSGSDDGQGGYTFNIANNCSYNEIGEGCSEISISKEYVEHSKIENCQYLTLTSSQTTAAASKIQNLEIKGIKGVSGTPKVISHDTVNDNFITTYQPANSQIISV